MAELHPTEPMPPAPQANLLPPPGMGASLLERVRSGRFVTRFVYTGLALALAAGCTSGGDETAPPASPTAIQESPPPPAEVDASREQDLLRDGTWDFMPGAKKDGDGLRITHTGLAILKMDEGGRPPANPEYTPNPPVNLFGTHVEMQRPGDVSFDARLSGIKGAATLSFLSAPSVRFDERLERQPGVDITVDGNEVTVKVWDGTGPEPSMTRTISLPEIAETANIFFIQSPQGLGVEVNNQAVLLPVQVLKRQVWFGMDAIGDWKLGQLTVSPVNSNLVSQVDTTAAQEGAIQTRDGLRGVAMAHGHGDKLIGTAVDLAELLANPEYADFVKENFNQITTETLAKFQALQPEEGNFQFAELDALVAFANAHGLKIHGHALAFTEAYPKWLHNKLNDPATTEEEALKLLTTHIETVVSRYDGKHDHGKINSWDVVNEPFDPDDWAKLNEQNIWYKKLGPRYIAEAFKAAHRANPEARLFLNEWGSETDADRREAIVKLAFDLYGQGIPIHGIGFQAHFDEETLNDAEAMDEFFGGSLMRLFDRIAQRGLLVRISEASVAENGDPEVQSRVYETLISTAVRSRKCVSFVLWGATNSKRRFMYFTGSGWNQDPGNDAPTTQDANGTIHERPAMAGLRAGASVK